jgi:N6-adenosine-specific RNA methylase IME4
MKFRVTIADPNWAFDNAGTRGAGEEHYGCSPLDLIKDAGRCLPEVTADDAILGLWCPSAFLITGEAAEVAKAWGYVPKQMLVWLKVTNDGSKPRIGPGNYFRNALEPLLVCSRGRGASLIQDKSIANWIEAGEGEGPVVKAPRGRHSAKPEVIQDLFERLVPGGPYLELYARRQRPGWECLGHDLPGGGGSW